MFSYLFGDLGMFYYFKCDIGIIDVNCFLLVGVL